MSKTIQEKDQDDTQNHIQKEYQLGKNIVVKVASIFMIILFTGCSKDIHLDPIQSLGNQVVKKLMESSNDNK